MAFHCGEMATDHQPAASPLWFGYCMKPGLLIPEQSRRKYRLQYHLKGHAHEHRCCSMLQGPAEGACRRAEDPPGCCGCEGGASACSCYSDYWRIGRRRSHAGPDARKIPHPADAPRIARHGPAGALFIRGWHPAGPRGDGSGGSLQRRRSGGPGFAPKLRPMVVKVFRRLRAATWTSCNRTVPCGASGTGSQQPQRCVSGCTGSFEIRVLVPPTPSLLSTGRQLLPVQGESVDRADDLGPRRQPSGQHRRRPRPGLRYSSHRQGRVPAIVLRCRAPAPPACNHLRARVRATHGIPKIALAPEEEQQPNRYGGRSPHPRPTASCGDHRRSCTRGAV